MSNEEKIDKELWQEQMKEETYMGWLETIAEVGYDNLEDFIRDGAIALRGLNEALNEDEKTEDDRVEGIEAEEIVVIEVTKAEHIDEVVALLREEFEHTRPVVVKFGSERKMIPGMLADFYKKKMEELETECMLLAAQCPENKVKTEADEKEDMTRALAMEHLGQALPELMRSVVSFLPRKKPDFYARTVILDRPEIEGTSALAILIPRDFAEALFIKDDMLMEVILEKALPFDLARPFQEPTAAPKNPEPEEPNEPEGNGPGQEPAQG